MYTFGSKTWDFGVYKMQFHAQNRTNWPSSCANQSSDFKGHELSPTFLSKLMHIHTIIFQSKKCNASYNIIQVQLVQFN